MSRSEGSRSLSKVERRRGTCRSLKSRNARAWSECWSLTKWHERRSERSLSESGSGSKIRY